MKTYVITLSKRFPSGHIHAGEPTCFREKFFNAVSGEEATLTEGCDDIRLVYGEKVHTIRANYPLWAKRIAEVERGKACLSIRQWTGKPYRSKQVEIARLTKDDGVGIQELIFDNIDEYYCLTPDGYIRRAEIAQNDGLSLDDWISWFKGYDLTQPLAIIHFTSFRY